MVQRDRINEFRRRFGIGRADSKEFSRLRERITLAWTDTFAHLPPTVVAPIELEFGIINGTPYRPRNYMSRNWSTVETQLQGSDTFTDLISTVQNLLWAMEQLEIFRPAGMRSTASSVAEKFIVVLRRAIDLSPGVDLRLEESANGYEFFPAGAELLDVGAVNASLGWLTRYPDVLKEFSQALQILAFKERERYRHAQDALRFAIEKLLKLVIGNSEPLEKQTGPLKSWLEERGVHDDVRAYCQQVLTRFVSYSNEATKHDNEPLDGELKVWSEAELEFVIYMVATLIRFISEIDRTPRSTPPSPAD